MKRGASGLCGVLAIDKPYGITSHDVVNRVRSITGERRVGHAGTLDPAATGLMLVGVGAATRLSGYLTGHDKEYDARIVLGVSTDTDDAQGRMLGNADIDGAWRVAEEGALESALASFIGEIDQLPPAYSAIKKNGVTAYKAAREGTCVELSPRKVKVYSAMPMGEGVLEAQVSRGDGSCLEARLPYWDVHFAVSKGTYIRALARDIGVMLGCGAHLGALRRTAVAGTSLERACTLEELEACSGKPESLPWCDPASLLGFPVLELDDGQADGVLNGRSLEACGQWDDGLVSCVHGNRLLAVYDASQGVCRPATVIPGGVAGVA